MQGYLSIFTKILVLVMLISSSLILFDETNKKRYEYSYIKEMTIKEKYRINLSVEEELSYLINFSCKNNITITKIISFPYEVEVASSVCGIDCFPIEKNFSHIKLKGKNLITIDCFGGKIYDR